MGTRSSIFFAVTDLAAASFANCTSLEQWYEVLSTPEALHGDVYLSAGESIACWRAVLARKVEDPLYCLFYGTVNSGGVKDGQDGSGDPDGYFLDSASLAQANNVFRRLDAKSLRAHYDDEDSSNLEEHLAETQAFLSQAVMNGHALAALWG